MNSTSADADVLTWVVTGAYPPGWVEEAAKVRPGTGVKAEKAANSQLDPDLATAASLARTDMANFPEKQNGWKLTSLTNHPNVSGNPGKNYTVTFRKKFGGAYVVLELWGDGDELTDLITEWLT